MRTIKSINHNVARTVKPKMGSFLFSYIATDKFPCSLPIRGIFIQAFASAFGNILSLRAP